MLLRAFLSIVIIFFGLSKVESVYQQANNSVCSQRNSDHRFKGTLPRGWGGGQEKIPLNLLKTFKYLFCFYEPPVINKQRKIN